jgi:hypothetical protein
MRNAAWFAKFGNPGGNLRRVQVRFAHTRTSLLQVGVGAPGAAPIELRFRGLVAYGEFEGNQTANNGEFRLRVRYLGEAPRPVAVRFSAGSPQPPEPRYLLLPAPDGPQGTDQPAASGWSVPLEADSSLDSEPAFLEPEPQPEAAAASRKLAVEEHFSARELANAELCRALRFFTALDRRSDPDLAPAFYNFLALPLMPALWLRVEFRASAARSTPPDAPLGRVPLLPDPGPARPLLNEVAQLFRELHDDIYAGSPAAGLAWGFELFASGRLASQHPHLAMHRALSTHGVPDSLNYLLFAELALACLEAAPPVEPALWGPLLPALVGTCAYFLVRDPATGQPGGLLGDTERLLPMAAVATIRGAVAGALAGRPGGERELLEEFFGYIAGRLLPPGAAGSYGGASARRIAIPAELEQDPLRSASALAGSL